MGRSRVPTRRLGLALERDHRELSEANVVAPTDRVEPREELLIAEPAIGEQHDVDVVREHFVEPAHDVHLVLSAPILQLRLLDRLPNERRRTAMRRRDVERDRRLVVVIEFGPVERHEDLLALTHDKRDPWLEPPPDVDPAIAQQTVHLLDRVLRIEVECVRETTPDRVNSERRRVHHADHAVGQRQHPHRVDVFAEQLVEERVRAFGSGALRRRQVHAPHSLPRSVAWCRDWSCRSEMRHPTATTRAAAGWKALRV